MALYLNDGEIESLSELALKLAKGLEIDNDVLISLISFFYKH